MNKVIKLPLNSSLSIGWFGGEDFKLFKVAILEIDEDSICFFHLQIFKFCLSLFKLF